MHVVVWMFVIPVSLPWLFKPLKKKQSVPFSRGAAHNFKGSSELPSANNGRLPAPAAPQGGGLLADSEKTQPSLSRVDRPGRKFRPPHGRSAILRHVSRRASGHEVGRGLSSNIVGGWRRPPAGGWGTDRSARFPSPGPVRHEASLAAAAITGQHLSPGVALHANGSRKWL